MSIEVLWRNENAVAINKPAGLATQAPADLESVESLLKDRWKDQHNYIAFPHRLDRDVSGVLLVALTKKSARLISQQFSTRKVQKLYRAVVVHRSACPDISNPVWVDWIRKVDGKSIAETCHSDDPGAREAQTVLQSVQTTTTPDQWRLELKPKTGRMHQLRLQCSIRGFPIVGDVKYGAPELLDSDGNVVQRELVRPTGTNRRILLHAFQLDFYDPSNGKHVSVTSDCPF